MELIDRIENSRFLAREFLLWLWYESDRLEGRVEVEDGDFVELWFEETLVLTDAIAEVRLKAPMPTTTPEAFEALRQGKRPALAKLRITRGTQAWTLTYKAETTSLSGVTLPAELREDDDEGFYERVNLVEQVEAMVAQLMGRFLALRCSRSWGRSVVPKLQAWVQAG